LRTGFRFITNAFQPALPCNKLVFATGGHSKLQNPLRALLDLPEPEKIERGLQHTPREIWHQPETWQTTYKICREHCADLAAALARAGISFSAPSSPTVYLVGAGTSDYSGHALAPLLRRRWGCEVWPLASTTLLTDFDEFHQPGRTYLWLSISRSGDSPEGVALLQQALEQHRQIHHIVITCNQQGTMAHLCAEHPERALALVLDDAVNDRGLAMTSSFTNMVVAGQCLGNLDRLPEYGEVLAHMVDVGSRFLPNAAEAAASMTALGCSRTCFVGAGVLRAVAKESALKVVELSGGRVTTVAESPLGLRHGPMSSVDGQTLFVAYLSSDPRRRGYELDLLREIDRKRLGRLRSAVTANGEEEISSLVDFPLSLHCRDNFPDEYRPVLDVMLGQLLGLFASMRSGLKPDQPSPNGAITRVVSPIRLYT
jgi:tagatose-6-phosphate ketose/aldose isomerase